MRWLFGVIVLLAFAELPSGQSSTPSLTTPQEVVPSTSSQAASSSTLEVEEFLDTRFLRVLSGNDGTPAAIKAVQNLSQVVKASIADMQPLDLTGLKEVLFSPRWQFMNTSGQDTSAEVLMEVFKNPVMEYDVSRKLVRIIQASPNSTFLTTNLELPTDLEPLKDVAAFIAFEELTFEERVDFWSFNSKLVQLQPPNLFQRDLDSRGFLEDLVTTGQHTVDEWRDLPTPYLRLWHETVEAKLNDTIRVPFLQPLVGGTPDTEIVTWLQDWTEDKQGALINLLSSSSDYLTPSQLQLLIEPLMTTTSGVPLVDFRKTYFDFLDVTQLQGLMLTDLNTADYVDVIKYLRVARNVMDPSVIANNTDPATLVLYPALKLQDALDDGRVVLDKAAFNSSASRQLTRGQASVLVSGFFAQNSNASVEVRRRVLAELAPEYLFAMPFSFIMDLPDDLRSVAGSDWVTILADNYDRLLPSQRLAMVWRLSKTLEDLEEASLLIDFASNSSSFQLFDAIDSSFMTFTSPKMYRLSSLSEIQKKIARRAFDYCRKMKIDALEAISRMSEVNELLVSLNEQSLITPLQLSVRRCMNNQVLKYLDTKSTIYNSTAMGKLTDEEAYFGGAFWTGFSVDQLTELGQFDVSIGSIGRVSFPELMAVSTSKEMEAFSKAYMKANEALDFGNLGVLGSLAFFVGNELENAGYNFKVFVKSRGKRGRCQCLPQTHRENVAKAIVKAYGEPGNWTMSDLLELGDLIAVLEPSKMEEINTESLRRASSYIIKESCFALKYESFPSFTTAPNFEMACSRLLKDEKFDASLAKYKNILFQSTLKNVRLALLEMPKLSEPLSTTTPAATNADKKSFIEQVNLKVRKAYSSQKMSRTQEGQFALVLNDQEREYRSAVADIFGVGLNNIPRNTNNIREFLARRTNELTGLQIARIGTVMNEIGARFTENLIKIMGYTESDFGLDRQTFCSFASVCGPEPRVDLGFDVTFNPNFDIAMFLKMKDIDSQMPPGGLCYAVTAAGFAATSLTVKDLMNWPEQEVYECLEILGSVPWPKTEKRKIWKFLKDVIMSKITELDGVLQGGAMSLLKDFLDVIVEDDLEMLKFDSSLSIEPLSVLGTQQVSKKVAAKIAAKYTQANNLDKVTNFTPKQMLEIAALGNLVCGLPLGMIGNLLGRDESGLDILTVLGSTMTSCADDKVLKLLARNASLFQKAGQNWDSHDLAEMSKYGIIAAGVDPETMSNWPALAFISFTPETVSHLTSTQMAALSPSQIDSIPIESLAVLKKHQFPLNAKLKLSAMQIAALDKKTDSMTGLEDILIAYKERLRVLDREGSSAEGHWFDFNNEDKDQKLYPEIDRADTLLPEPEGNSASRKDPAFHVRMAFIFIAFIYIWLVTCCLI